MANTNWDRKRAAHLYRRAGFGARPEELDRAVALGREGAVSALVDYDAIPIDDFEAYMTTLGFDLEGPSDPFRDDYEAFILSWWYKRMQYSPRPLQEKMTLFWHGHFATSSAKVDDPKMMYVQNQIFRRLGMGNFGDLLLAVSRDPAMLIWLDGVSNVKGAPNENFSREVMELFTMGVGNYTEEDVKESARAYTGWTIDYANPYQFVFDPSVHDDGVKGFLGRFGNYTGEDIIAILAARPETATFVSTKLARFFLGDDPSPALSASLQTVFASTTGNIREVVRTTLLSDDFDATADRPDMIKSPVEFVVGVYRQLGAWANGFFFWPDQMGQAVFRPPNVGGWKGGQFWANTGSLLLRINFALTTMTQSSPQGNTFRWEPRVFFEGRSFESPDEVIDFVVERLNMITPSDTLRKALRDYLALSGDPFVWNTQTYDNFARGLVFLLMSSPEYQMQ